MEHEDSLSEWEQPNAISTQDMDDAIKKLQELDEDYERKKKISSEAHERYENQRVMVLEMLKKTGKKKYHVDGVGTVSMAIKLQVSAPKDPASKKEMLEYFKSLGDELFNSYVSINHQTLNSYVKQQVEIEPGFVMPGVGSLTETPELRFKKG